MQAMTTFREILEQHEDWSATKVANALGIKPQAVSQWVQVPLGRVPAIEAATGIPRHVLRPDFWPEPKRKGRAA